jgi:peptide/nickel transport system permease protein
MTGHLRQKKPEAGPPTPRDIMFRRMRSHYGFLLGVTILGLALLTAVAAPLLAPYHPFQQKLTQRLIPPVWQQGGSWEHLLGTDGLGRDFLSRLIYGVRVSLVVGLLATIISGIIGSALGLIGGSLGGSVDGIVMYIVNTKLSLPGLLLAIALVTLIGGSLWTVTLVLGFLLWDRYAVVVRSATQQVRSNDYVIAAQAAGASTSRIIACEILPNVMSQIIVVATLEMALAILAEAGLSFLGLGIKPPTPSWGLMMSEGRNLMFYKPYLVVIPGIALFILVMGINLLGDGLREIIAPEGRN